MGLFDFVKNAGSKIFGKQPRDDDDDDIDVVKPLRQHLKEHGIDPTNIRTRFVNGVLVVEGTVPDQDTREKAILVLGNVDGVGKVDDRLTVGRGPSFANVEAGGKPSFGNVQAGSTSTAGGPRGGGEQNVGHASAGGNGGWTSRTYTVKKGDTLSEIAKEQLGKASRYPEIFEMNKPMLKDPDKIYPGQVLRLPAK